MESGDALVTVVFLLIKNKSGKRDKICEEDGLFCFSVLWWLLFYFIA